MPGWYLKNSKQAATLKAQVLAQYGPLCHLCGGEITEDFTLDHLIPRSHGGNHEAWNLRPAHRQCNQRRGNKPLPRRVPRPSRKW